MKSLITLIILAGVGLGFCVHAELKRGTIVGAYRLAEKTSQGFNILIEAVANPRFSNQRLFYLAEEQNNKILRKGTEHMAQIVFEKGSKAASLLADESDALAAAEFNVSRTGVGVLHGKMGNEVVDARISLARNCRLILTQNN